MDQENQKAIQYGKNFEIMMASEGWKQVEDLLDAFEEEAMDDLTDYLGSDNNLLRIKQLAYKSVKRTHEALTAHIQSAIETAHELIRGDYSNERHQ